MNPFIGNWEDLLTCKAVLEDILTNKRAWQMLFKRPYQSDQELEKTCLDIATYLLKEVWKKLKNKKRVWKIKKDSNEYDLTKTSRGMVVKAIRMGYCWRMACFEKNHIQYLVRAAECNKMLYSFFSILDNLINLQVFDEESTMKLKRQVNHVDCSTQEIIFTQGQELTRRNACTYDMGIEAYRELQASQYEAEQKVKKLKDKISKLSGSQAEVYKTIRQWLNEGRFLLDRGNGNGSWLVKYKLKPFNIATLVQANLQLNKCISWLQTLEAEEQTSKTNVTNAATAQNVESKKAMEYTPMQVTETNGVKRKELRERSILYGHMVTSFFMTFGKRKHPMAKAIGWEALRNVSELGALCYAASAETTYPNFRHNFDTCKQTLCGLFYWMNLLTNAKVFQSVKKRGELCRAGFGLYDMMLDVARNGGFVPDQGKAKKRGKAAKAETSSMPGNETVTLEMVRERCGHLSMSVSKACENCQCLANSVAHALIQRAIDCGDCAFIYSKKIGQYDFFDMVTYCEKQARMCEYYLLLAEEFLPHHKDRFVFIRQEIRALAELLSRFSVHNNIEQTQKYNLPFPEPVKRRKSPKRQQHKDKETKKGGSGPTPGPSGK